MTSKYTDNCFTRGLLLGNKGKIPHELTDISYIVEGSIKEILEKDRNSQERMDNHESLDKSFSRGYLKGLERYLDKNVIQYNKEILSNPDSIRYIIAGYNKIGIINLDNKEVNFEAYSIGTLIRDISDSYDNLKKNNSKIE